MKFVAERPRARRKLYPFKPEHPMMSLLPAHRVCRPPARRSKYSAIPTGPRRSYTDRVDELFETFDSGGVPRGLAARARVHALGWWHKSTHVILFDARGDIYLQLRAADKDLYQNLWDYSVGEHLQPGESFHAAALRGLREELGVENVTLQPMQGVRSSSFNIPELDLHDCEFQQAFRGTYDGPVHPDLAEVAEVRLLPLAELDTWLAQAPERFTPWLKRDLLEFGFLAARQ